MAATRTPGITIDTDGNYLIDKRHRGTRICLRLGQTTDADPCAPAVAAHR